VSLVLPWIGAGLGLLGGARIARGHADGWWLVAAGVAVIVLDTVIDFIWARSAVSASDEPHLNRRGHGLIGRTATVVDPIEAGRGRVRVGDTVWPAEGPDCAPGTHVDIADVAGTVLRVALRK
jgi:hypothetical protein